MKKKTHEQFMKEVQEVNPKVEILDCYCGANEKMSARCVTCGYEWVTTPHALLRKRGCPKCALREQGMRCRKDDGAFKRELAQKHPNLHVLSTYRTSWDDVTCYCDNCQETFDIKPAHVLYRGCKICNVKNLPQRTRMSKEEFVSRCKQLHPTITVLQYEKASSRATFHCSVCGTTWKAIGGSVLHGTGCPTCCISHGEKKVKAYLVNNKIEYEAQKTFENLVGVGGGLLSYDFFLPGYGVLIEYQGEYHFGKGNNQTTFSYRKQQVHDTRKRQYASEHGFVLLEIPYTELRKIDTVLDSFFNNLQNPVTITA